MSQCQCPACGHLHPKFEKPAPFGNCGVCGSALPPPNVAAHRCHFPLGVTTQAGQQPR